MPLTISRRIAGITPSATLVIDARAKAMKAKGEKVIGFAAGEPDFPTPKYICDAAHEAIDRGYTRYTPSGGTIELKRAICEKLKQNQLAYGPENIIVATGAKPALLGAFSAVLDPGDEVLLPSPYWVSYPEMIRMAGGVPVLIETTEEAGFLPTAQQLSAKITPRTKAILVNSPSNPTGAVYPRHLLEEIAQLAIQKELFVISDEIYERFLYDGMAHVSIASLSEAIKAQTVVVNGVSKTYAMTGWRIGYAAGPKNVIGAMDAHQSHATSNANSIAQYASVSALENGEAFIISMRDEFDMRRQMMVERINKIEGLSCIMPHGAFYVMLNVQGVLGRKHQGEPIEDSLSLCQLLLQEAKVATIPGEAFGMPGYLRLSYAVSREDIVEGLEAIERFVKGLSKE